MIYKIQQIFEKMSSQSNNVLKDKEQLGHFTRKLLERKIIIEHDIPLINKFVLDFPVDFNQFCAYIRQIFKLDIEQQLESKTLSFEECLNKILKFLNFYSYENLNSDDLYEILKNLNLNIENIRNSLKNIHKVDFLLKNIRDDIQKFLWDKIYENGENQTENANPEFFITDASEYQQKMQAKIEYEYEITRTKKVHFNYLESGNSKQNSQISKKLEKILVEKAHCSDRDIPIQSWKIPNSFFKRGTLSEFYYKCEALRELTLSRYFQKFTGYDDYSFDDYQIYFFEYIEGVNIIKLLKERNLELTESSILFKYLAKEILSGFRDLLYKSTYSLKFPITIDNIYYEPSQLRLYFQDIDFGPMRRTILESHQIVEAKLLYFYGLILINLLAYAKPDTIENNNSSHSGKEELKDLVNYINTICKDFKEFDYMQNIFDHIIHIEEVLTRSLENDVIIAIIIECLISPYKAKLVFDEFYNKKNFLKDIFEEGHTNSENNLGRYANAEPVKKEVDMVNLETQENEDKYVAYEPYYQAKDSKQQYKEDANEILPKKIMSLNSLLIHPFFDNLKVDNSFISFLFNSD